MNLYQLVCQATSPHHAPVCCWAALQRNTAPAHDLSCASLVRAPCPPTWYGMLEEVLLVVLSVSHAASPSRRTLSGAAPLPAAYRATVHSCSPDRRRRWMRRQRLGWLLLEALMPNRSATAAADIGGSDSGCSRALEIRLRCQNSRGKPQQEPYEHKHR
jgi:hypothetical protein